MLWDLIKVLKKGLSIALAFVSLVFTFSPESFFAAIKWSCVSQFIVELSSGKFKYDDVNIVLNRVLFFSCSLDCRNDSLFYLCLFMENNSN